MSDGGLLDLVCGPASPLPETHQRYRLVQHLGSGGQAEVYRAVRVCSGVSSAPMTVKVFRVDPNRPLADELRSWDKGDAALMDLNNRGVPNICRRADGFYGPPPHRPGEAARSGAVPVQVYDYIHGINLREYVAQRVPHGDHRRLNALTAMRTLAQILRHLHHPEDPSATPVLHMDVKPANLMVLPTGEVRLIDFTGARYYRRDHITQIAYTPEAGGPEAFTGRVSPAYDVHGYGAVAYYMVTGAFPRAGAEPANPDSSPPPWAVLRAHPVLDSRPQLRDHLLAPLADRPEDRPTTKQLDAWLAELAKLVQHAGCPDVGVDWGEPGVSQKVIGRATLRRPVAGTQTGEFQRIERLERELAELRTALGEVRGIARPTSAPPPVSPAATNAASAGGLAGAGSGAAGVGSAAGSAAGSGAAARAANGGPVSHPTGVQAGVPLWPTAAQSGFSIPPTSGPGGPPPPYHPPPPASGWPEHTRMAASGVPDPTRGAGPDRTRVGLPGGPDRTRVGGQDRTRVGAPGVPDRTRVSAPGGPDPTRVAQAGGPNAGARAGGVAPGTRDARGKASVNAKPRTLDQTEVTPSYTQEQSRGFRPRVPSREGLQQLTKGWEISGSCALFTFVCWGVWLLSSSGGTAGGVIATFLFTLAVAVGVFAMCRLLGRLIFTRWLDKPRRTARASHIGAGVFLVAAGIGFVTQSSWYSAVVGFFN